MTKSKNNQYAPQSALHPSATLIEKLEELGMGPKEFAVRTGKPEKTITAILKGESSITPDMAILFENVLHIPAHFWMNKQRVFDEFIAREKNKVNFESIIGWAKGFPISDMINKGWIPVVSTLEEKAEALLKFFRLSSPDAWEDYYFNQQLKVDFRISLNNTKEPFAISAWLRQGEIEAEFLETKEFDEKKFKLALVEIKKLMATNADDFFKDLQTICLACGVNVVYTPCLPKAPISGSTRWINNTPLIQMSGRYKRIDSFWFTFFHEVGHLFLHGKKDIFLEEIEYSGKDVDKEKEADDFAVKWTFSKEEEEDFVMNVFNIDESDIEKYARKIGTNPALIVGRLQTKGLKPRHFGTKFLKNIEF